MFDFISNDKISKSFFFLKYAIATCIMHISLLLTWLQKLKKCSEIPIHSVVKKPPKNPQNPATQNILQ